MSENVKRTVKDDSSILFEIGCGCRFLLRRGSRQVGGAEVVSFSWTDVQFVEVDYCDDHGDDRGDPFEELKAEVDDVVEMIDEGRHQPECFPTDGVSGTTCRQCVRDRLLALGRKMGNIDPKTQGSGAVDGIAVSGLGQVPAVPAG